MIDHGACCAKCELVGLKICGTWFFRADTKRCFLKVDGQPDAVIDWPVSSLNLVN